MGGEIEGEKQEEEREGGRGGREGSENGTNKLCIVVVGDIFFYHYYL